MNVDPCEFPDYNLFLYEKKDKVFEKKATKRLFVLRTLKKDALGTNDLVLVYCSIFRSIVEYASPVWAAIPLYLEESIESVQRKALKIIFGRVDYAEALVLAGLESLSDRRVGACKRFITEPSKCHSNFALNFFCLDFFLAFKFFSRLFSRLFCRLFPPTLE